MIHEDFIKTLPDRLTFSVTQEDINQALIDKYEGYLSKYHKAERAIENAVRRSYPSFHNDTFGSKCEKGSIRLLQAGVKVQGYAFSPNIVWRLEKNSYDLSNPQPTDFTTHPRCSPSLSEAMKFSYGLSLLKPTNCPDVLEVFVTQEHIEKARKLTSTDPLFSFSGTFFEFPILVALREKYPDYDFKNRDHGIRLVQKGYMDAHYDSETSKELSEFYDDYLNEINNPDLKVLKPINYRTLNYKKNF